MYYRIAVIIFLSLLAASAKAQEVNPSDSSVNAILKSPEKYITSVSSKATSIEQKLDKKSEKAIAGLKKQEEKIIRKLQKIDSSAAKQLMENAAARYKQLEEKLKNQGKLSQYIPQLDSLGTSLNFLNQNSQLLSNAKEVKDKLQEAMKKMDELKAQLQKAEDIKQFLKERKQYLKEQLSKFGFVKELTKINKEIFYYAQQVNEYKEILKDPKKIEKKALELLSKTKLWKDFFAKNSMLASLFRLPGSNDDPNAFVPSLAGLQTRAQVSNLIQTQIAAAGPNAQAQFQQNIQSAQAQLNQLKDKVMKLGGGSSDIEMPEGFKPNTQKTKSFWKRIEVGTNLQSQKGNGILPATSDIGLSLGYKLNDKSIIGVGSSFKVGLGTIEHIKLTGQGASVRSFVDWKLKGSFWISGGYEMNYRSEYRNVEQLRNRSLWQQSGLVGVSKTVSIKSKFFKKTKLQLMWDYLSYRQVPVTQPIIFRIGYNF